MATRRSIARRLLAPAALAFAVVTVAPAAAEDLIFEDGFEVSGVSPWSTAVGLPPGARLDIYLDAFQTLDSTEIIDRVDVDFTSALNVTAVISGYVMVPVAGSWQLRLSYSPLGDLRVDGVLIGGYIDSPLYCQSNSGTVDTESEAMATGAILQFQIRYVAGCWTLLWDRKVSLWWRKSSGDAWERVPAAGTFH